MVQLLNMFTLGFCSIRMFEWRSIVGLTVLHKFYELIRTKDRTIEPRVEIRNSVINHRFRREDRP